MPSSAPLLRSQSSSIIPSFQKESYYATPIKPSKEGSALEPEDSADSSRFTSPTSSPTATSPSHSTASTSSVDINVEALSDSLKGIVKDHIAHDKQISSIGVKDEGEFSAIISGQEAAAYVAYKRSDSIFVYPLVSEKSSSKCAPLSSDLELFPSSLLTAEEARNKPKITQVATNVGGGSVVEGYLEMKKRVKRRDRGQLLNCSEGSNSTLFLSSAHLPYLYSSLLRIKERKRGVVVHLTLSDIEKNEKKSEWSVRQSHTMVYQMLSILSSSSGSSTRSTNGPTTKSRKSVVLSASSPQECHDMAVFAHRIAAEKQCMVVLVLDGVYAAKERTRLTLRRTPALFDTKLPKSVNSTLVSFPEHNTTWSLDLKAKLSSSQHQNHDLFEYRGDPNASLVAVVMGEASQTLIESMNFIRRATKKSIFGVLQVRVVSPWSANELLTSLPATFTERSNYFNSQESNPVLCALDRVDQHGRKFLYQQVFGSVYQYESQVSQDQRRNVRMLSGVYGVEKEGFTSDHAHGIWEHLYKVYTSNIGPLTNFSVGLSETSQQDSLCVPFPPDRKQNPYVKSFVLYGNGYNPYLQELKKSIEEVYCSSSTYRDFEVHSITSAEQFASKVSVEQTQIRVCPAAQTPSFFPFAVSNADMVVMESAWILKVYDVLSTLKEHGTLLLLESWKDEKDMKEALKGKRVQELLVQKQIHVYSFKLDSEDPSGESASDDDIVQHVLNSASKASRRCMVSLQTAFFKLSTVMDNKLSLNLLHEYLDKSFKKEESYDSSWLEHDLKNLKHWNIPNAWYRKYEKTIQVGFPFGGNCSEKTEDKNGEQQKQEEEDTSASLRSPLELVSSTPSVVGAEFGVKPEPKPLPSHIAAWKIMFPEAYSSRARLRSGVEAIVPLTKYQRLTPQSYSRNVFHMELDLTGTGFKYHMGSAVAIHGENPRKEVLRFLSFFNFDGNETISLPSSEDDTQVEVMTLYHLVSSVLDILGRPSRKFYEAIKNHVSVSSNHKQQLENIVGPSDEAKATYQQRSEACYTFADILYEFSSFKPTIEELVAIVPRMKPRHYSIASSDKMYPDSVHLLVVVHTWESKKRNFIEGKADMEDRVGNCSEFLSLAENDDSPQKYYNISLVHSALALPADHRAPVIMVALGTGLAPFRAFVQEREVYRRSVNGDKSLVGPMALYFGARTSKDEFLYGEELVGYTKGDNGEEGEGVLTHLRTAFSRDQKKKIYVQNRLEDDRELLQEYLLKRNGSFYICGPTWPVPDVEKQMVGAFVDYGMTEQEARDHLEVLKKEGRYVLEVY